MDGCGAVAVSLASQVDRHAAITVNTVVPVVNLIDLLLDLCFFCVIIRLPVFPVVIVGVRADPQPPQQPADAKFYMMLIDEPVSL